MSRQGRTTVVAMTIASVPDCSATRLEAIMSDPPTPMSSPTARPVPRLRLLLAVIVGVVAVVALAASADDNEATLVEPGNGQQESGDSGNGQEGNGTSPAADRFAVGDMVELGDWQVTVNSVVDPWVSPEEFDVAATGRYVAVDVTVVNNSDGPETVSSLLCFELRDADGRSANSTFVLGGGSAPDGEIDPGGRLTGTLYYDVPAESTGLELRFQCDLFSRGSAVIAL